MEVGSSVVVVIAGQSGGEPTFGQGAAQETAIALKVALIGYWHWVGLANGARQPPDVFGLAAITWACTTQEDGWEHCTVNWTFTLPLLESFSTMKAFP